jgi:hypothetical protein
VVVDQQLQPFALNDGQDFRHHFIDQILNGEEGGVPFQKSFSSMFASWISSTIRTSESAWQASWWLSGV